MKKYAIAIHAGAQTVNREQVSEQQQQALRQGLQEAINAGRAELEKGSSAIEAVVAAVRQMEDNPLFNAGKGGSLNRHGETRCDAAIMDGQHLKAGAVGALRHVKNPVLLAKAVMEHCRHTFMAGTGAEEFALAQGLPLVAPAYFVTQEKRHEWHQKSEQELPAQHDTVGAVALDQQGNLAAATSTGGLPHALKGRISDSPLLGGGTYANNPYCAVSCTGDGDTIMRGALAHEVYAMVKYAGENLQAAADKTIRLYDQHLKGDKGLIAMDPDGEIAFAFNTNLMRRAYAEAGQQAVIALWDDERT